MLSTNNLSFAFGSSSSTPLQFPNFTCQSGEHWLLLGQSGSGKTTLLHLLAGLRSPLTGTVSINGTAINELKGTALDQFRGREIGIVFQQAHFVRALTVRENLALARKLAGLAPAPEKISELLERLNIAHKQDSLPSALSVGEQQRAAIARALVNEPSLILADEPTGNLDEQTGESVRELIESLRDQIGIAFVLVTHDMSMAKSLGRVLRLEQGELFQEL